MYKKKNVFENLLGNERKFSRINFGVFFTKIAGHKKKKNPGSCRAVQLRV